MDSILVLLFMINLVEKIIRLLQNFNNNLSAEQLIEFDKVIAEQVLLFNKGHLLKTSDKSTQKYSSMQSSEQNNDLPTSGSYLVLSIYEKAKAHLESGDKRGYKKTLMFILDYLQYVFACFYIPLVICPILFATTSLGWMVLIPLIIGSVFFISWCITGLVSLAQNNYNRERILNDHIDPVSKNFKSDFKHTFINGVNNNAREFKKNTVYQLAYQTGGDTMCVIGNTNYEEQSSTMKTVSLDFGLCLFRNFKEKGDSTTLSGKVDDHYKLTYNAV